MSDIRTPKAGEQWTGTNGVLYTCVVDDADSKGSYLWAKLDGSYVVGQARYMTPPAEPENPQPAEVWAPLTVHSDGSLSFVLCFDSPTDCQITMTPVPRTVVKS